MTDLNDAAATHIATKLVTATLNQRHLMANTAPATSPTRKPAGIEDRSNAENGTGRMPLPMTMETVPKLAAHTPTMAVPIIQIALDFSQANKVTTQLGMVPVSATLPPCLGLRRSAEGIETLSIREPRRLHEGLRKSKLDYTGKRRADGKHHEQRRRNKRPSA